MKRDFIDYIYDIINSIKEVESFTENINFEDFSQDKKTINATIRSLEVLGEASKKIPETIRRKYQDIPWKRMAGMRDKLIHEYFGVRLEILWKVIKEDIPGIKPALKRLLESVKKEQSDDCH